MSARPLGPPTLPLPNPIAHASTVYSHSALQPVSTTNHFVLLCFNVKVRLRDTGYIYVHFMDTLGLPSMAPD